MRKKKGILITAVLACTVALGAGGYVLAAQTGKKEAVQETKRVQTILPVLKVTEDREMENQEVLMFSLPTKRIFGHDYSFF